MGYYKEDVILGGERAFSDSIRGCMLVGIVGTTMQKALFSFARVYQWAKETIKLGRVGYVRIGI